MFAILVLFSIIAYNYDPSHKILVYHWLPYVVIFIVWTLSIFSIDIGVANSFKDGAHMFNGMLAGFTPYENEYYDEEVEYDGGAIEKRGVPKKMDILKE